MREGIGSTVMIAIIAVFIAVVSGYLAFNVNYMKAFNMKNKIIDYFNKYEGECTNTSGDCYSDIEKYAKSIGYHPLDLNCGEYDHTTYYCYKSKDYYEKTKMSEIDDTNRGVYYEIVTRVDINIPIVENVFKGVNVFFVKGNTKVFKNVK